MAKKNPVGRPTKYRSSLGEEICDRLAGGSSLSKICRDAHMPEPRTVRRWVLGIGIPERYAEEFRQKYELSRALQAESYFDEVVDIPDAAAGRDSAGVAAAKNRSDARKWVLARMNRSLYGDKSDLNIAGQSAAPPVSVSQEVDLTNLSPDQRDKLREMARQALQKGKA